MLDMYNALILFGVLLIAGVVIRELVPPLQKVLLPASLIGGTLGLILGQQVLGVIEIPELFAEIPGIGMRIVMACVPIGITVTAKRVKQHLDFTFTNMTAYGFQVIVGLLLGILFMKFWPSLPEGWGLMGVAAYFGSHGNVPIVSEAIDPTGALGAQSIGMIMATLGILFAMIPGMFIANYGARRGWTTFTSDLSSQPKYFYRGPLPEEKREPIGRNTVNGTNVSAIALHLGIIAITIKFGEFIFRALATVVPILGNVPPMLWGIVGGLILWPAAKKLKLDKYVDKDIITQISNFTLEMIILGAFATIQLDIISQLFVPLFLHALISCGVSGIFIFTWMKWIGNPQWFEKSLMLYGMCTGANPQGLALVRSVDPDNRSVVYEALGVYNALFFWNFMILPLAASLVLYNTTPIYLIGLGLMFTFVIGMIIFSKDKKARVSGA